MSLLNFGKSKKPPIQPGRLIVIDGNDGSGKATQTQLLIEELTVNGYQVKTADFPRYGNPSAVMVERYLMEKKYGQVNPKAASIFYAIDRYDASFEIRQWLAEGFIVVSNRYVTASAGHQGGKIPERAERVKFFRWLDHLEYEIFAIPRPDLNVILHVPAETAHELAKRKWDRQEGHTKGRQSDLHEEDLQHMRNAETVFLEIATLFPNTKLVDCELNGQLLTPQDVHNKVWELVRRIVFKKNN